MWQFGELGYGYGPDGRDCLRPSDNTGDLGDCPGNSPGRTGRKPIRWDYRADPLRWKLYKTWSALINLRREHPVFHDAAAFRSGNLSGDVKTLVLNHPFDMDAVVVGNFAVSARTATPGFLTTGTWYDYFTGDSLEVTDTSMTIELQAGEFHVFTTERLPAPEAGLITVDIDDESAWTDGFALGHAYPNPARSRVTIEFELSRPVDAGITVYDVLGRRVVTVGAQERAAGTHVVTVDVDKLAAGVYFYRLVAGNESATRTFVVER